jgi:hypothetical protein
MDENDDYPGIFELTPFERWCIDEFKKSFKQFKKRIFS